MVEETTLARRDEELPARSLVEPWTGLNREQVELVKQVVAPGLTDDELRPFLEVCRLQRLNPISRQVYAIKRYSKQAKGEVMTIQTSIDGLRLIADRTGRYVPGREPGFTYDKDGKLVSATAYVKKLVGGEWHEIAASARYDEYCQRWPDGNPMNLWATMPCVMLAKTAEAAALRRAFPAETSGIYTHEEMAQADNVPRPERRSTPEATKKATQRHETAPSYAAATIVPETEEARRERAVLILRGKLTECAERYLWDRDDLDLARWADYDFSAGTAEEIMENAEALEAVLQIARRAEGYQQETAAAGDPVCEVCQKRLTSGQAAVSRGSFQGRMLCPVHQREAKEAARG